MDASQPPDSPWPAPAYEYAAVTDYLDLHACTAHLDEMDVSDSEDSDSDDDVLLRSKRKSQRPASPPLKKRRSVRLRVSS